MVPDVLHREGSWCRTAADWSDAQHGHDLSGNCSRERVFQHGHTTRGIRRRAQLELRSANNARTESPEQVKEKGSRLLQALQQQLPNIQCGGRPWSRSLPWDRTGAGKTNERAQPNQSSRADSSHGDAARLTLLSNGGTIDGRRGHHVLLAPLFIINDAELELIVERLFDPECYSPWAGPPRHT